MDDPGSPETLSNQPARRYSLFDRLFDVLLPIHCVLCGRAHHRAYLCEPCAAELPVAVDGCPLCAIDSPPGQRCGQCQKRTPAYDRTMARYRYVAPIDRLVQTLKYAHDLSVARALGEQLVNLASWPAMDVIVPVPLHATRLAERGFNQAVELARPLVRSRGLPLWLDAVVRTRNTSPQAGSSWAERRRNVRGVFAACRRFDGLRVLVVDDVMTTGATLDEMARCLKTAGAVEVTNLVCARTPSPR